MGGNIQTSFWYFFDNLKTLDFSCTTQAPSTDLKPSSLWVHFGSQDLPAPIFYDTLVVTKRNSTYMMMFLPTWFHIHGVITKTLGVGRSSFMNCRTWSFILKCLKNSMPSLVDHEHFSGGQIQNLGAPSSNEWLVWREPQRCACAFNDDGVPEQSFTLLAASFRNLFKPNQRAKVLGSTFQKNIFTDTSNCGVQ